MDEIECWRLTAVRVQVEGSKVQGRNIEVVNPGVSTCRRRVRVRSIASSQRSKALVAKCHHVVGVQRLDVFGRVLGPVVDDRTVYLLVAEQLKMWIGLGTHVSQPEHLGSFANSQEKIAVDDSYRLTTALM